MGEKVGEQKLGCANREKKKVDKQKFTLKVGKQKWTNGNMEKEEKVGKRKNQTGKQELYVEK